jgi:hypothetical protein
MLEGHMLFLYVIFVQNDFDGRPDQKKPLFSMSALKEE